MKKSAAFPISLCLAAVFALPQLGNAETVGKSSAKPVFGEYQDWSLLAVSHRQEKNSLRAILGNDKAIAAARQNQLKPWPDGAILAKVAWKASTHPHWLQAIVPGDFEKAEAMIKDSKKYATTGGWGFAYWEGKKLVMHEEAKAKECFACHTAAKESDYVFTASALQ